MHCTHTRRDYDPTHPRTRALVRRYCRCGGTGLMHKRAEYNGILVSLESLTPGKLQQWLEQNPQADAKEVKQIKRRIRLAKEEESE